MTEAEWQVAADPGPMFDHLLHQLKPWTRKWRLFACACGRRVSDLMPTGRERQQADFAERLADDPKLEAVRDYYVSPLPDYSRRQARSYSTSAHLASWFATNSNAPLAAYQASCHCLDAAVRKSGAMARRDARSAGPDMRAAGDREREAHAAFIRDIFGNPFRPASFSPAWRTSTALTLARQMYESRDFSLMPILADALQDAGCEAEDILAHCRGEGPHVRGCWVVDLVLGKE